MVHRKAMRHRRRDGLTRSDVPNTRTKGSIFAVKAGRRQDPPPVGTENGVFEDTFVLQNLDRLWTILQHRGAAKPIQPLLKWIVLRQAEPLHKPDQGVEEITFILEPHAIGYRQPQQTLAALGGIMLGLLG